MITHTGNKPFTRMRQHWPLLAAGMLSQACPSAAPLFHTCALWLSVPRTTPSAAATAGKPEPLTCP